MAPSAPIPINPPTIAPRIDRSISPPARTLGAPSVLERPLAVSLHIFLVLLGKVCRYAPPPIKAFGYTGNTQESARRDSEATHFICSGLSQSPAAASREQLRAEIQNFRVSCRDQRSTTILDSVKNST